MTGLQRITLRLPGHAALGSGRPRALPSIATFADNGSALLDHLGIQQRRSAASSGAASRLRLARWHPDRVTHGAGTPGMGSTSRAGNAGGFRRRGGRLSALPGADEGLRQFT